MIDYKILINGKMKYGDEKLLIKSPLNNESIGSVPMLTKKDIDYAFESARKAFPKWSKINYKDRIKFINEFDKIMMEDKKELALRMVGEICKAYHDCIVEIDRSSEYIKETIKCYERDFASPQIIGEEENHIKGKTGFFKRVPSGVVLAISPFNYPVNLSLSKIIPALIAGNTVVFKPATQGSITGAILSNYFFKSKLPSGVINVVTGRGSDIGDDLIKNKESNVISFTGSPEIGNKIRAQRGDATLILELGGNDPAIVEKDADIDNAVKQIISGAFGFSGQRCTAIKVIYAHHDNKDELIHKLKEKISNLVVGSPFEKVDITPLISRGSLNYSLELMEDAKSKKGKILIGGNHDGNFLFPTLIELSSFTARLINEEQFSPLVPILFYNDVEKVISHINKDEYGLQASIFTASKKNFWKLAEEIETGTINWNRTSSRGPDIFPFMGVKNSGQGVQGIYYAIESMTRLKGFIENE